MGEDVVDITTASCHFYKHLLIIYPVPIALTARGYMVFKMRMFISFPGNEFYIPALFDTLWQSLEDIQETIKFNLFIISDKPLNLRF